MWIDGSTIWDLEMEHETATTSEICSRSCLAHSWTLVIYRHGQFVIPAASCLFTGNQLFCFYQALGGTPTLGHVSGGKQFRLEYKNFYSLDLAKDGTGQVYNTKMLGCIDVRTFDEMFNNGGFDNGSNIRVYPTSRGFAVMSPPKLRFSDKKKDLPADVDAAIKALFELYDPLKKGLYLRKLLEHRLSVALLFCRKLRRPFSDSLGTIGWPQFAEVDRIVTECLGGQYEEMISRRAFSMMNYPGLSFTSEVIFSCC